MSKPLAYVQGESGPAVHINCWPDLEKDYMARTGCRPFLGAILFKGHPKLAEQCPVCRRRIDCPKCGNKGLVPGMRKSDLWRRCGCGN